MSVAVIEARTERTSFAREENPTLVMAARNGSGDAFARLFEGHRQMILGIAMRLTNNREDAEDITQQSFQKAFMHLHEFEGRSSFSTWVARIAFNEGLMLLRSRPRVLNVPIEGSAAYDESERLPQIRDERSDPERSYSRKERQRILRAALNRLKPGIRRAVELFDLGGRSVRETAQVLGVSTSAVKSRVHRGRKILRRLLRPYALRAETNWPRVAPLGKAFSRAPVHRESIKGVSNGYPRFVRGLRATTRQALHACAITSTTQPSAGSALRF